MELLRKTLSAVARTMTTGISDHRWSWTNRFRCFGCGRRYDELDPQERPEAKVRPGFEQYETYCLTCAPSAADGLIHPELKRLLKQVGPRTRRSIDGSYWRVRYAAALRRFRNGRNTVG